MALTKVSRGLLSTGIVDNSNATAITLNADESATFAGAISVTGTATATSLLTTGAIASTAVDGTVLDRSGNTSRFVAGRSGGNYAGLEMHVAGASGVTKRFSIDYDSTTKLFAPNGTSEHLVVTSAGSVGIGVSTAYTGGKLSVNGGIVQPSGAQNVIGVYGTSGLQVIGVTGGDNVIGTMGANEPLVLRTGSVERMRIDQNGWVNVNANIATDNPADSAGLHFGWNYSNAEGESLIVFNKGGGSVGGLLFSDNSANGTPAERMRIDSSGRVGIGVTPPAWGSTVVGLDVGSAGSFWGTKTGATLVAMSDNSYFNGSAYIARNTAAGSKYYQNAGGHYWDNAASVSAGASQTNVERMRIDSGGDVFIASAGVYPSASQTGFAYRGGAGGNGFIATGVGGTNGLTHHAFYNPNGVCGQIYTTGSGTVYVTSSDYRLKENVVGITGATQRLLQLKPSRFNFIADANITVDGFLAHEVQDVVPEAIIGTKDAVDADGNPDYQGIDQSKLVPLLVATIQELEARLTALENN